MSYTPNSIYGSLYQYEYTTPLVTTGGGYVKLIGFTAGDSLLTTVSTGSSNITLNQSGEVMLNYNGSFGINTGSGPYDYSFGFFVNGTQYHPGDFVQTCNVQWGGSLEPFTFSCLYNGVYGDVIDIRVSASSTAAAAEPVFYLGNLSVKGVR